MVPPEAWAELRSDLKEGRVRPALVILDRRLSAAPEPIVRYLRRHYRREHGVFFYTRVPEAELPPE